MRRLLLPVQVPVLLVVFGLVFGLASGLGLPLAGVAASEPPEQSVRPLTPGVEQRVEFLTPGAEQRVEMVDAQGLQGVAGDATQSRARRGVQVVGKVVIGVVAAAVSCGVMLASLLLL